jgi:hypothetical protein
MAAFPARAIDVPSDLLVPRAAVSALLGRYRGETRLHTESDLRVFLGWCTDQDLDPLAAVRVDIERYVRWLRDVRRYQPSTVSRRLSVVVGFYRVCVIDQLLPHAAGSSGGGRRVAFDHGRDAMAGDLNQRVTDIMCVHPQLRSVHLAGSRARGTATLTGTSRLTRRTSRRYIRDGIT